MGMAKWAIGTILLLGLSLPVCAQEPFEGHTLISPINSTETFLMDMDETVLNTWHGAARPSSIAYLLEDGSILRPCRDPEGHFQAGGAGGRIQRIDPNDIVVWDYSVSTDDYQQHHDIEPLPNGNILVICWEKKTLEEALAAGRVEVEGEMWPTLILEVEPVGTAGGYVVWEWHLWDHLIQDVDPAKPDYGVITDHPELLDINYGTVGGGGIGIPDNGDWIHANAIDYNPELDQIVFSSRATNEFYIIDHSTTTPEAAGHTGGNSGMGGDILYRWGNPLVYARGSVSDQYFFVIHGVNWIDEGLPGEGNLLCFNNGDREGTGDWSSVDEIVPPVDQSGHYEISAGEAFGPSSPRWTYGEPGGFYSGASQCGAYRLPNGNTLICQAEGGYLFEVTQSGTTVWDYDYPSGNIARAQRYWEDTTPVPTEADRWSTGTSPLLTVRPNPFNPSTSIGFTLPREERVALEVFGVDGRRVVMLADGIHDAGEHVVVWDGCDDDGARLASGVYFIGLRAGTSSKMQKVILLK
jgi:hypothetical protein